MHSSAARVLLVVRLLAPFRVRVLLAVLVRVLAPFRARV